MNDILDELEREIKNGEYNTDFLQSLCDEHTVRLVIKRIESISESTTNYKIWVDCQKLKFDFNNLLKEIIMYYN